MSAASEHHVPDRPRAVARAGREGSRRPASPARDDAEGAPPRPSSTAETRRPEAGFSLFEVLVAVVLLAVGALAVARSMGTALASGTRADRQTRAAALGVEKLETLKSRPASEVDDEGPQQIDAQGEPDPDGAFRRTVTVLDADEGARPNTKEVTVTVEFDAGEAGRQSVELFTILFVNDA